MDGFAHKYPELAGLAEKCPLLVLSGGCTEGSLGGCCEAAEVCAYQSSTKLPHFTSANLPDAVVLSHLPPSPPPTVHFTHLARPLFHAPPAAGRSIVQDPARQRSIRQACVCGKIEVWLPQSTGGLGPHSSCFESAYLHFPGMD